MGGLREAARAGIGVDGARQVGRWGGFDASRVEQGGHRLERGKQSGGPKLLGMGGVNNWTGSTGALLSPAWRSLSLFLSQLPGSHADQALDA